MTTTHTLLALTTALAALVAIPAIGAVRSAQTLAPSMAVAADRDAMLILASGEDDDDDDGDHASRRSADDDCEDDDEGAGYAGAANPAPAGTVAPPANGLFGTGTLPQVQMN